MRVHRHKPPQHSISPMKRCIVLALFLSAILLTAAYSVSLLAAKEPESAVQPALTADGIPEPATKVNVASLAELDQAINSAKPGTQIILADGVYTSTVPIAIKAQGSKAHPIVVSPQTVGGAEIGGVGSFVFDKEAAYVVLRGFKFTHAPDAVKVPAGTKNCRVSRNLFELKVEGRSPYLDVAGDDAEIDHNEFRNKNSEGQMLLVVGPGTSEMAQRVWIHHNYFHDFRSPGKNNCSALHIGMSGRSMSPAWSITEYNLFVKCAGENEGAICNKCCDNIYRFNTFGEGSTELSLRHGNRCDVYANYFIGCTGIRFFGHDHKIFSNYFERCRTAIAIGNGGGIIPPAKLTEHDKPVGVHVVFNSLVNNRNNMVMGGRNRGLGAADTVIANNIIQGGSKAVTIGGPMENPTWEGNLAWETQGGVGDIPAAGVKEIDPKIKADPSGEFRLQAGSPAIGAAVGSYPYVTVDVNGLPRGAKPDVGASQFSNASTGPNRILTPTDVGTLAVEKRIVPDFDWGAKRKSP
jgi:poly(beta-D-mannuronate) lyase